MGEPATRPVRLQLSRQSGFNLLAASRTRNGLAAVNVARPTKFGNPFIIDRAIESGYAKPETAQRFCVDCFEDWLSPSDRHWQGAKSGATRKAILDGLPTLRGKNLACWCAAGAPCHADVLLELANAPEPSP